MILPKIPNNVFLIRYGLDCLLIFKLFDQIEDAINVIDDDETKDEFLYDFKIV